MATTKSFKQIMDDMVGSTLTASKIEDLTSGSAIKALLESIEHDMYFGGCPKHERGLRNLLLKLGIKSAKWEGGLAMSELNAAINQAVYNHGRPTTVFMDPKSLEQLNKLSKK